MSDWEIEYYETADGHTPVKEYLDGLSARDARDMVDEIDFLQAVGIEIGMPHARQIRGTRLWELRTRGRNHHRVFYVTIRNRRFLLLHAFAKKTQQTPKKEIAIAERRLVDYEERTGR